MARNDAHAIRSTRTRIYVERYVFTLRRFPIHSPLFTIPREKSYLKQLLKSIPRELLALGNACPTALTDKNELESLLYKLFPVTTDNELIRLGPQGDGGYLVPDDLSGIEACFSPGVSLLSGFEKDCADRGMNVFLADRSVDGPAESHDLFHFTKKFVGVTTNDDFMTMDDWVAASLPDSGEDLLLQMDIEGYEYETVLGMSDSLMSRFRIMVVEFHRLDRLWSSPFFQLASRAFEKILQTHTCVHNHPNNYEPFLNRRGLSLPLFSEFTFLRKDRITRSSYASDFPHPLDSDTTDNPHLPLPTCWYKGN